MLTAVLKDSIVAISNICGSASPAAFSMVVMEVIVIFFGMDPESKANFKF